MAKDMGVRDLKSGNTLNDTEEELSVFVPCYNEEKRLYKNILKIYDYLNKITEKFRIYIVNDNSTDHTGEIAKRICENYNKINCLHYSYGPTRRENLALSFKHARGEIIMFMDLDLSTDLSCTAKIISKIEDGGDIAIGSRYIKGAQINRKISRRIISFFYNKFVNLYFGTKIKDHECGFKAFKKEVVFDLINDLGLDKTLKRGVFWDTELLIRAQKKGYAISELPVKWNEGDKSTLSVKNELKMIKYMLKFKFVEI